MTATPWSGLLWDASALAADADLSRVAAGHAEHRKSEWAELLGPLVVGDTKLSLLNRAIGELGIGPLPVCVVNSSGAGGLISLAEREFEDLRIVAAHSMLRDLDDLTGNAARVAAAARSLDPDSCQVFVGLPPDCDCSAAAEVIEAEGLAAAVSAKDPSLSQASELIELDCPFLATDPGRSPADLAAAVLGLIDQAPAGAGLPADDDAVRVRRRLVGIWVSDPARRLSGS